MWMNGGRGKVWLLAAAMVLAGCRKEDPVEPEVPVVVVQSLLIQLDRSIPLQCLQEVEMAVINK